MPILIPSSWTDTRPGIPYVWICSVCQAFFDGGPVRGQGHSSEQINQINRQFEAHCKQLHPALRPVTGL